MRSLPVLCEWSSVICYAVRRCREFWPDLVAETQDGLRYRDQPVTSIRLWLDRNRHSAAKAFGHHNHVDLLVLDSRLHVTGPEGHLLYRHLQDLPLWRNDG